MAAHPGYGIDEGGRWFGAPRRSAPDHGPLFLPQAGRQGNPGKEPHQYRRGAGNGAVRPPALRLHSQMSAHLLESRLQLPAQHEPLHNPDPGGGKAGGQQRLGTELPQGVSNQRPSNGCGRLPRVAPEGGLRSEFHSPGSAVIPSRRRLGPTCIRRVREFPQLGQTLALDPGAPIPARPAGRRRLIERSIQPQSGYDRNRLSQRLAEVEQFQDGVAAGG